MKVKFISIVLLILLVLVNSAFTQQKVEWKGTIEYENGVKVIKNPNKPLYGEITFELEEDLSIGNEEDENYVFYRRVGIQVDSEGNIFVVDVEECRIQKFNKEGIYLDTIGRKGEGPGEFKFPARIFLDYEDNIYIQDSRHIDVFDREGKFKTIFKPIQSIGDFHLFKTGYIIAEAYPPTAHEIVLLDSDWNKIKQIASFPRDSSTILMNPFSPALQFCSLNDDSIVYGDSSQYELFILNSVGESVCVIKKDELPKKSLTSKGKEKYIDFLVRTFGNKPGNISREQVISNLRFPQTVTLANYFRIYTDDKSRIYVRKMNPTFFEDKSAVFDVFSKEGFYIYQIKIPIMLELNPLGIIKNGFIYRSKEDPETGYIKIKRYKIKNWDKIKSGISN